MKSLYNKVFKNNQITYGRPYQIKVPDNIQEYAQRNMEPELTGDEELDSTDPQTILENARRKGELLLEEAQLEVDKLLQEAQMQAEKHAKEVAEEAWQRGYAEGMEAAAEQYRALIEEAEKIRASAAEDYESQMNSMEEDMVSLALDVARKAVAGELSTNRAVIMQLIQDALPKCSNKNDAIIKVSVEDGDYLEENLEELYSGLEGVDGLEIKKDGALKPGDCIIETSLGSVDAGTETRLDKIEEAFKEELSGR